jgi:hypothetical protein
VLLLQFSLIFFQQQSRAEHSTSPLSPATELHWYLKLFKITHLPVPSVRFTVHHIAYERSTIAARKTSLLLQIVDRLQTARRFHGTNFEKR